MVKETKTGMGDGIENDFGLTYRASFTLEQNGLAGPITPKMQLDPMIDPDTQEVPAIYEYISSVALNFLRQVRAIDENNEVLDEDEWSRVGLEVMTSDTPDKGSMN